MGVNREGRNADWAQIPDSSPPFRAFRDSGLLWRYVMQGVRLGSRPRCGRALLAADSPRVLVGVGDGSAQGGRRDRREHGGAAAAAAAAAGSGVVCADPGRPRRVLRNSHKAPRGRVAAPRTERRSEPCRARPVPFGRYTFLPPPLTLRRVFAASLPAGLQVAESLFLRAQHGVILLPVMAGGA